MIYLAVNIKIQTYLDITSICNIMDQKRLLNTLNQN